MATPLIASSTTATVERHMCLTATALVALAGSLAGCAGDATMTGDSAAGDLPRWELQLDHRIGSIDDPDDALTTLGEVVVGPEGRLFVAQPREGTIRIFDEAGEFERQFGRQGEGPGEFGYLASMSLWRDTLYVADSNRGWVTFFSAQGDILRQARWTPLQMGLVRGEETSWFGFASLFLASDSTAVIEPGGVARGYTYDPPNGVEVVENSGRNPTFSIGPDGASVDTLDWAVWSSVRLRMPFRGTGTTVSCPWTARSLSEIRPVNPAVVKIDRPVSFPEGQAPAFAVTIIAPTGDTVARRDIPFEAVPLRDDEIRTEFTEYRELRMGDDNSYPSVGAMIDGFEGTGCIPPIHTPVSHLTAAQDGSIWLRREALRADSIRWDVLDATGNPMGRVILPAGQTVLTARDDVVIATEQDEFDVPYLVRYRIVR